LTEPREGGPAASLVVVNFNGAGRLTRCIESLLADADPERELLLVDNASTDGSAAEIDALERQYEGLVVVRNAENLGYAGAVNAALPRCRGRYVGVLNMDLEAEPGWLAPLVDFLDEHPQAGAVNPLLVLMDGEQLNAAGQDVHVTALGFNRALGQPRGSVGASPFPVSGIQGAAFLVRRELLERTGGMDATGFLYHEDVNLSWLLRMMGYELYCVPASAVRHDYFLSMYPKKLHLLERNRWVLLLSYLEPMTFVAIAPALLLTELMNWGYALLRGPRFLVAKATTWSWLWRSRDALRARRGLARALRTRADREVLSHMRWSYAWSQFATLAGERGVSKRRTEGRPPGHA
jgi:hypothetical protein